MRDLIFDFDGTLVDTGPGIINCVRLTLEHYGLTIPSEQELRSFVGPPLRVAFPRHGVPEDKVEEAVAYFRRHYATTGKDECEPYAGIAEALSQLKAGGMRLHVGTSKPEHFAHLLLGRFDLKRYFDVIVGAIPDGSRESKTDVLKCVIQNIGSKAVMIGDTHYDVEGAAALGIPTIGVAWGYEDRESLIKSGAIRVVDTPAELVKACLNK